MSVKYFEFLSCWVWIFFGKLTGKMKMRGLLFAKEGNTM